MACTADLMQLHQLAIACEPLLTCRSETEAPEAA